MAKVKDEGRQPTPDPERADEAPAAVPPAPDRAKAGAPAPARATSPAAGPVPDAGSPVTPGASPSVVKMRGRPGGVTVEIGEGEWKPLLALLEERVTAAAGFFRGGRVFLETGARALDETQLGQVRDVLKRHAMQLAVVSSSVETTVNAAHQLGLAASLDELDAATLPQRMPELAQMRPGDFVHRGSLRSGQVLRKTESIVLIGDVNPGAQVISGGDIVVWGRLRGVAIAGVDGNVKAVVSALELAPTQLRIATVTSIDLAAPEMRRLWFWRREQAPKAQSARLVDGAIVVELWDNGKSTHLMPGRPPG
jgi:septum site-determining protein MinC